MKTNSKIFEKYKLNNGLEIQSRLVASQVSLFASDTNKVITDEERDFLKVRGKRYGVYILGENLSNSRCYSFHRSASIVK